MERYSTMHFSIQNCPTTKFMVIGCVGITVWSLRPLLNFSGNLSLDVVRSLSNSKVKIDVVLNEEGNHIVVKYQHPLFDGQKHTRLDCNKRYLSTRNVIEGYITVHYNSSEEVSHSEKSVISSITEKINPSSQLAKDLLHLLDNPDSFSDATLISGTTKISVHRGILAARSPVFATMFKSEMKEGRDGIVPIVDIDPDVLKAMIIYVYSGKTDHLTYSLAGDLLFAADKYQLEELKLICVEKLKAGLDVNNVFHSLVLGDLHDESLKAHAVEFICKCKSFSDLEKSEEWQSLLKERSSLAVELLTTVVKWLQKK